jgi:hypothetical protein
MKKLIAVCLMLCLTACNNTVGELEPVSSDTQTVLTPAITSSPVTTQPASLQFMTQEEVLELAQTHMPILSEALYFLEEEAIEYFAVTLIRREIWELSDVDVVSLPDDEGWTHLRITIENEVYNVQINRQGSISAFYTDEQWELRGKHMEFLSSDRFSLSGRVVNALAGVFAEIPIQELVELEKIYDVDTEWEREQAGCTPENAVVMYLRVKDILEDVYYVGLCKDDYLAVIAKNAKDGERLYSPNAGGIMTGRD